MKQLSIEDRVLERLAVVGESGLTKAERTYWLIWNLEGQANNNGLEGFIYNCRDMVDTAVQALLDVGAPGMAGLLLEASRLCNGSSANDSRIDELSNQFTDYPEDLSVLLDSFVAANECQFLGPKTNLELWHARKDRGAETAPRRARENIDFVQEAAIDRPHSSRGCPECGQPVPDYRETCKRCGYPLGKENTSSSTPGGSP